MEQRHSLAWPVAVCTCASFFSKFWRSEDWTAASTDWQLSWQTSTFQSRLTEQRVEPLKQWWNLGSTSHRFINVKKCETSGCHQPWSRVNSTHGSRRASHATFHFPWPVEPRASAHHHHLHIARIRAIELTDRLETSSLGDLRKCRCSLC